MSKERILAQLANCQEDERLRFYLDKYFNGNFDNVHLSKKYRAYRVLMDVVHSKPARIIVLLALAFIMVALLILGAYVAWPFLIGGIVFGFLASIAIPTMDDFKKIDYEDDDKLIFDNAESEQEFKTDYKNYCFRGARFGFIEVDDKSKLETHAGEIGVKDGHMASNGVIAKCKGAYYLCLLKLTTQQEAYATVTEISLNDTEIALIEGPQYQTAPLTYINDGETFSYKAVFLYENKNHHTLLEKTNKISQEVASSYQNGQSGVNV